MSILNAAPLYLHQHHPSLWRPRYTLKSCRVMRVLCSVSSHVLSLKPLDTCQKNTLVPTELGISIFIAIFDYNTFRWLAKISFVRLQNKNENQNHSSEVSGIPSIKSYLRAPPKNLSQKHLCYTELITFHGHH